MTRLGALDSNIEPTVVDSQTPTPGATVTITHTAGNHTVAVWTAGEDETVNISGSHNSGDMITLIITNDGTLARTITLGTGFVSSGTIVGTLNLTATAQFVSDGTNFYEISRTLML